MLSAPATAWGQTGYLRSYGGSVTEFGTGIALRPDGHIVISSQSQTPELSFGICDGLIPHLDQNGNVIEAVGIGGAECDILNAICVNAQGHIFAAGRTLSGSNGEYDGQIIRLDQSSAPVWIKRAGGPFADNILSTTPTNDGGVVVAGSYGSSTFDLDLWLMKLDANGTMIWSQTYPGAGNDKIEKVIQTGDGGFLCVGSMSGNAGTGTDMVVMRTDADGSPLWRMIIGGTSTDEGKSICEGPDGSAYAVGWTRSFGGGLNNVLLCRIGSDGSLQWTQTYGSPNNEQGQDILLSSTGSLIITGTIEHGFYVNDNVFLLSTDPNGSILWQKEYGDPMRLERATRMAEATNGDLLVTGDLWGCPGLDYEILLLRTNAQGACAPCNEQSPLFVASTHLPTVVIGSGSQQFGMVSNWPASWAQRQLNANYCGQIMPLAVELISAVAVEDGIGNRIDWITASESGSDHFRLESSPDGNDFNVLDVINAVGDSYISNSYSYQDRAPFRKTYYRLVEVDTDARETNLATLFVHRTNDVSIYVDHALRSIEVTSEEHILEIRLIDMAGRSIIRELAPSGTVKLNVPNNGVFLLVLINAHGDPRTLKIVV